MGQYSVIGLNPYLILKECDGIFYENDVPQEITFEEGMQKYLEKQKEENPTSLPLIAGALGYFSYDYGRKFEQISSRHPKKLSVPDALFVFYDLLIIDDKIDYVLPVNYKELSQMVRGLNKLFGVEFYNKDYYEEINYLFDSLVNGYHINMSTEEVETYCYQLCNYVLKRIEGEHV